MQKRILTLLLILSVFASCASANTNPELTAGSVKKLKGDTIHLKISGATGVSMFRTSVPGGWLVMRYTIEYPYRSSEIPSSSFIFVPDYNHEWVLETGNTLSGEIYSLKKLGISNGMLFRARLPGGWLVFHYNEGYLFNTATNGLSFIPDPNQEWVID